LWGREEFQPVAAFLNSMAQEAILNMRMMKPDVTPEGELRANLATHKNQLNFANLMLNLPLVVKTAEEAIQKKQDKVLSMQNATEGGSI